jgi:hypothetical protein
MFVKPEAAVTVFELLIMGGLKLKAIVCVEMLITYWQSTPRKIPEGRKSHSHHGGSRK